MVSKHERTQRACCAALVAVAAAALCGCASGPSRHAQAADDLSARVRFASTFAPGADKVIVDVVSYADATCAAPEHVGALRSRAIGDPPQRKLGLPLAEGLEDLSFTEVPAKAGQELFFGMRGKRGATQFANGFACGVTAAFRPEAGKIYEARLVMEPWRCHISVEQIVPGAPGFTKQPERSARKIEKACL